MSPDQKSILSRSGKSMVKVLLLVMGILLLIVIVKQHIDEKNKDIKTQAQRVQELMEHKEKPDQKPRSLLEVRFYVVNGLLSKASLSLETEDDLSYRITLPTRKDLNQYGSIQKYNRSLTLEPDTEMFLDLFYLEGDHLDLVVTQAGKETRYEDVRKGTYALLLTHDYWVKWKSIQYSISDKGLFPRSPSTRRFDYNALGRGLYVIDPEKNQHLIFSTEKPPAQQEVQFASPFPATYYIQVFRSPFHS